MVKKWLQGGSYLVSGLDFVYRKHLGLLRFCLWPVALAAISLTLFICLATVYHDELFASLWARPDPGVWRWVWAATARVVLLFALAGAVTMGVLVFWVVAAPFNDSLSQRVEVLQNRWRPGSVSLGFLFRDGARSVWLETIKLLRRLSWLVPLYLFSLVLPLLGPVFYIGVSFYRLSLELGMEMVDWSLARRDYSVEARFVFATRHDAVLRGFGGAALLGTMVPVIGLFLWPGVVAGGTIMALALLEKEGHCVTPVTQGDS